MRAASPTGSSPFRSRCSASVSPWSISLAIEGFTASRSSTSTKVHGLEARIRRVGCSRRAGELPQELRAAVGPKRYRSVALRLLNDMRLRHARLREIDGEHATLPREIPHREVTAAGLDGAEGDREPETNPR